MEANSNPGLKVIPKTTLWTGRVISAIVVLFMLFDSITKIMQVPEVMETSAKFGYPASMIPEIGTILFICIVLYVFPRTSILGAILMTGYFGGAVEANMRTGAPLFSNVLFPVYFGILLWVVLYLRSKNLLKIMPV